MSKKKQNRGTPVQENKQENLDELLGLSTEVTAEAEQPVVEVQEEVTETEVQEVVEEVAAPADEVEQPDLFPETLKELKTYPSGLKEAEPEKDGTIRDYKGNVLFKRKQKKNEVVPSGKKREVATAKPRTRIGEANTGANSNPTNLVFPTDRWGVTKDLKKAFIYTASRVAGDEAKKQLVDDTLAILLEHLEAKFKVDAKVRKVVLSQEA